MTRSDRSALIEESLDGSDEGRIEAVLRVLGGDDRIGVARDLGVDLETLDEWIRVFLQAGRQGLRESEVRMGHVERLRAWSKIGELTMRVDLLRRFITRKGYADQLEALDDDTPSPTTGSTS